MTIDCENFAFGTSTVLFDSCSQPARAPVDVDEIAFFARRQADVVSDANLLCDRQIKTREQIRQRVLQRERNGETADTEGGQDGRDLQAQAP